MTPAQKKNPTMVIYAKSDHTIPPTPGCVIISQSRPTSSSGGNHGEEKEKSGKTFSSKQHCGGKKKKQKEAFSVCLWLSILSPWVVKMPLLARLFGHCFWEARRSQRRGYKKKRDNLLMFVDI